VLNQSESVSLVKAECLFPEGHIMSEIIVKEFDDLKSEVSETGRAAAAIGACIACTLLKSDPTHREALAEQAGRMAIGLAAQGHGHAATLMHLFARSVARPEIFSSSDRPD
jgi:hypothetical protein